MNREEALRFMLTKEVETAGKYDWANHRTFQLWIDELIDKIYDDFESKTCSSCKFYKVEEIDSEDEMRDVMTGCSQFYMETNYAYDFKNFGGGRWESKNDKQLQRSA